VSAPARLAGFAAILALVFVGALAVGSAAGPQRDRTASADAHGMAGMEEEGGSEHAAARPVRGLAVSDDGLTLRLASPTAVQGRSASLRFRIVDRDGATVRDFDVEHTKRMHVVVVRRDLTGFQHLHPTQQPDGGWSVPLTVAHPGTYRVFADFSHDGTAETLADDLQVDGTVRSRPLPPPVRVATADGLEVRLGEGASHAGAASTLSFTVTRDGRPVAVEDYLGAKGHLVALREGDLAFLHVHPDADRLRFSATFPTAGRYRLFLQVQAGGTVHTAAFTQVVAR
jgi:hypothetical protein